jgi:hypothetical protein
MYIEAVFYFLTIHNLKNFVEKECSLIYINIKLNFYKIGFVLLYILYGLLISCFENRMDNCQFVTFNAKIDTIKK